MGRHHLPHHRRHHRQAPEGKLSGGLVRPEPELGGHGRQGHGVQGPGRAVPAGHRRRAAGDRPQQPVPDGHEPRQLDLGDRPQGGHHRHHQPPGPDQPQTAGRRLGQDRQREAGVRQHAAGRPGRPGGHRHLQSGRKPGRRGAAHPRGAAG